MITIAVAAGDPAAIEYYRGLMADAKFEAVFTPEIEQLTQCVKSRPIDLVLFDVSSPALPATAWLEAVRQDGDLALTPVLWVGMARPMALATTLDNYRPGARTRQRPNLTSLMELVKKIMGAGEDLPDTAPETDESSKEWQPELETIDDALSIFDAGRANGHQTRPLPDEDDEDIFQTSEIRRAAPTTPAKPVGNGSTPPPPTEVLAVPSIGPEEKVMLDFSDDEEVSSSSPVTAESHEATTAIATKPVKPQSPFVSEELIDEITNKVISRLAAELFRNLDTGAIRQAVREVLAEQDL